MQDITEWLKSGEYLPEPLRDFHRQKSLFKFLDQVNYNWRDPEAKPDWITAHCYVIDVFLWVMAKHGYTLQKTRKKVVCSDLNKTLDRFEEQRIDSMRAKNADN